MPTDFDISAEDSKYLNRIQECFPHLVIETIQANQDGWINDVLIVNEQLVFRFPKNETWARDLLANEIRVIQLARNYLDVQIPEIEYQAADLMAYRFISGSALQRNDILVLDENERDEIAHRRATYLKQLHSIPMDEILRHKIAQSDTNRDHRVWVKLFEDVKGELFPLMMPHAREWVTDHFTPIFDDEEFMNYQPCLINGDTTPYHILSTAKRAASMESLTLEQQALAIRQQISPPSSTFTVNLSCGGWRSSILISGTRLTVRAFGLGLWNCNGR